MGARRSHYDFHSTEETRAPWRSEKSSSGISGISPAFLFVASLAHVREALMIWKNDYNLVRPHSAIGNLAPSFYAELSAPGTQRVGALRYTGRPAPRPVAPPSQ